ncbi:MAG: APC family permease [Methanobacterium sp.]|nr:APC family permease [Methanobacterium sp.]
MYQNKSIGLISAIAIGIGGMIGAGIFSILGLVTEISGNVVYISFIFGGVIALLSTYSYAKLGTKYPSAGGAVEFLIRGFGDGILSGGFNFLLWFGYVFALAVYAEGFGNYAATFLPPQIAGIGVTVFAVAVILLFTLINVFGAKSVGRFEILIVTVKLVILLGFACVGLFFIKPSLLIISQISHVSNVIIGACILFIGYEGFGLITNTAEDIDQPQKNIPRALYIAVFLTILIYIFVSIVLVGNLSITEITRAADYALAAAAEPFAGSIGFTIIAIGALFSTASAINATLFGGANVSYLMAKKGELPKLFNRNTWHNSKEGLFITSLLVIIITVFLDLGSVAMMGSAAFLLIYAGVNIAHLKIYKKTKANKYIIILAIIGCIFSFSVLVYYEIFNSPITLITLVTVIFASFLIEWIYRQYTQRN